MFVVTVADGLLVFDAPFDDVRDEYLDEYSVYFIPWSEAKRLHGSWKNLTSDMEMRGRIPVHDVEFDPTRRLMVSADVVALFSARRTP